MRIEVWSEKPEEEQVLRLRLVKEGDVVVLVAVDSAGCKLHCGSILWIAPTGKLYRATSCDVSGIKTNDVGRILLDE